MSRSANVTSDYIADLLERSETLADNDVSSFFVTTLGLFERDDFPLTYAYQTMAAVNRALSNGHMNKFIEMRMDKMLPLTYPGLEVQWIDFFYALAREAPNSFTPKLIDLFIEIMPEDRFKSLCILGFYARQFNEIENPWPLLDCLFTKASIFRTSETSEDYAGILLYLYTTFPVFREARGKHCWNRICELLNSSNNITVNAAYCSLCQILEHDKSAAAKYDFPTPAVIVHLRSAMTRDNAISLLLRMKPRTANTYLVKTLMEIAQIDTSAALIVCNMAKDLDVARIIVSDCSWMGSDLPDVESTMCLFGVVLRHKELRPAMVEDPSLITLFQRLCRTKKDRVYRSLSSFLHHLPLTVDLIEHLKNMKFFENYFRVSYDMDTEESIVSCLIAADAVARVHYISELDFITEKVCDEIKEDSKIGKLCFSVGTHLAKHYPCMEIMRNRKIVRFFKSKLKDPHYKNSAEKFLKSVKAAASKKQDSQ